MDSRRIDALPRRLLIGLLAAEASLALLHIVFTWPGPDYWGVDLWRLFHVDREANLPTWFSALQLALLALVCAVIWMIERDAEDTVANTNIWAAFAAGAVFLSADEAASIHERLGHGFATLVDASEPGSVVHALGYYESYYWALLYAPIAIPLSAFVVRHAWRALWTLRWRVSAAVAVFLTGAIVLDFIEGRFGTANHTGIPYTVGSFSGLLDIFLLEELMEMVGVTIVLHAFAVHGCERLAAGRSVSARQEPAERPPSLSPRMLAFAELLAKKNRVLHRETPLKSHRVTPMNRRPALPRTPRIADNRRALEDVEPPQTILTVRRRYRRTRLRRGVGVRQRRRGQHRRALRRRRRQSHHRRHDAPGGDARGRPKRPNIGYKQSKLQPRSGKRCRRLRPG